MSRAASSDRGLSQTDLERAQRAPLCSREEIARIALRTEEKTRLWLAHHNLLDVLGLDPEALHFCRKRPDKGPICKRLGVTHFIDDRMDVLTHLTSVRHRILFGPQDEDVKTKGVVRALTWSDVAARLL